MQTLHLISNTGEKCSIQVKTGWADITIAEYINMQGKPEAEVIAMLTGLDTETLAALDLVTMHYLSELLTGLQDLPEESFALNIEYETIGQYETAKSFIKRYSKLYPTTYTLEVMPVLYGLYKAEKVDGKWHNKTCMTLAEAAKQMPVAEVAPFAMHVLKEINRVIEKEAQLAEEEPDPDFEEAGGNKIEAFGFYPTLNALAGGDILKQDAVMQLSVINVHAHLRYLKTHAEVQRNLQELKKEVA